MKEKKDKSYWKKQPAFLGIKGAIPTSPSLSKETLLNLSPLHLCSLQIRKLNGLLQYLEDLAKLKDQIDAKRFEVGSPRLG